MTKPTDDQQPQTPTNGEAAEPNADDGWEKQADEPVDVAAAEVPAKSAEDDADAGKAADEAEAPVADQLSDADYQKKQTKEFRDKYAASKGEAETLRKAIRKLEADGLLDRDEIATAVGVERGYIDAVIDRTELPEAGEPGHMDEVNRRMDEDYRNPSVQKALSRAYGTVEEQQELAKAFNFAMQGDAELKAKFENVAPEDAIYLVLDEGKVALEDFRQFSQMGGSAKALAAENRSLKAEIAELKKPAPAPSTTVTAQANDNQEQPSILDPLRERETRLAALRR